MTSPSLCENIGLVLIAPQYLTDLGALSGSASVSKLPNLTAETELTKRTRFLSDLTLRFRVAYAAATTEWVGWRLQGIEGANQLLQFAEALWASVKDMRYATPAWRPTEVDPLRRKPPTPGSSKEADLPAHLIYLTWSKANALWLKTAERDDSACTKAAGALSTVARSVLPKKAQAAFLKQWLQPVLARAAEHWLLEEGERDPQRSLGPAISREALDPSLPFDPSVAEAQLDAFIRGLDFEKNPYLSTPDEMKRAGFGGTPYA